MIIVSEAAPRFKTFLAHCDLKPLARTMMMQIVLAFIMHRGRMSCSAAAGVIASEPIHRGELTRFLARPRWQKYDFNEPLARMLLAKEKKRGNFLFLIDATLVSQAGKKTQNTFSTGNRTRRKIKKGFSYNNKKVVRKNVHSFTFGLLITPSGIRIPMQIPHRTKEYCAQYGLDHLTTAEAAAQMIRTLPLDDDADVVVLGDTAYESSVVETAWEEIRSPDYSDRNRSNSRYGHIRRLPSCSYSHPCSTCRAAWKNLCVCFDLVPFDSNS